MVPCNEISIEASRLKSAFLKCSSLKSSDLKSLVELVESVKACGVLPDFKTINNQQIIGSGNIQIDPTVIPNHNDLAGIQGGSPMDFQHVTNYQINDWNSKESSLGNSSSDTYLAGDKTWRQFPAIPSGVVVDQTIIPTSTNAVSGKGVYDFVISQNGGNVKTTTDQDVAGEKKFLNPILAESGVVFIKDNQSGYRVGYSSITSSDESLNFGGIDRSFSLSMQNYNSGGREYLLPSIAGEFALINGNKNITAPAFYKVSDIRKKDIISRDGEYIEFKWKDSEDGKVHFGVVAQEVEDKNLVNKNIDGFLSVNYIEMMLRKIALLEKQVKELQDELGK